MPTDKDFDAIVIGSGAGGSMAARALARRGMTVLVLEKGENRYRNLADPDFSNASTDFSNDELKLGARDFITPDPLLEPRSFRTSPDRERDFVGDVNGLPTGVGGGLNHADWKARRMRPSDFRLKTLLGEVEGASVVDWPISYDDLEPFYYAAERIVGVQGPDPLPAPFAPDRKGRPHPMRPGVPGYSGLVLAKGAERLGLEPFAAPTGITSQIYRGRPACNDCGFDGGFGCPIGAKGTPAVTALRDALLTGKVELRPNSMVVDLEYGEPPGPQGTRKIERVVYRDEGGTNHAVTADLFFLAASPIESARIALLSRMSEPGRGNTSGLLGRNLMFHYQTIVIGVFPQRLHPHRGRTITHMFDDFCGPADVVEAMSWPLPRGGTVELGGTQTVIDEGKNYQRGPQHKTLMRVSPLRDRLAALTMQGEDLPQTTNFVDLDYGITDAYGQPVPRITYASHSFEIEAARFYTPIMIEVLTAAGAVFVAPLGGDLPKGQLPPELEGGVGETGALQVVPASRHIMGVFRMGPSRDTGVTDPLGRFWDFENLYSADGAVFPTSSGMNPSLTIMALAYRTACAAVVAGPPTDPLSELDRIDADLFG